MNDHAPQIEIPPSFVQLYLAPGRSKPSAPWAQVLSDYELCEDMAQMLAPTAADMLFKLGVTERDVLERCYRGLRTEPCVLSEPQSAWVLQRMAEILSWPWQNLENVVKA
ncbi:ATPase with chaperone activity [Rhodoferax sp.]|uniref:ATPase with chaperone activity n=1 Tax=Rhodoferax sp. TaxID=50421 RepID=UPI0025D9651E|nr:ATPase with chaperone activity [Rhodoferax sp.]